MCGQAGDPRKGPWRSSPHLAVCSLPVIECAAGAVWGTHPPPLSAGAMYVLLPLTFISPGPVELGRCLV